MSAGTFSAQETISISATATSGSANFTNTTSELGSQVRVYNAGPNVAFVRFGPASPTAVTTDIPIAPGSIELFHKGGAVGTAAICATGQTATVYFTAGEGL